MIRTLMAASLAALMVGFTGCGDDNGTDPVPPDSTPVVTYLKKGDKVLYQDTIWIQWAAAINSANAVVQLSSRKSGDSAWCGLAVVDRGDKSARVVVANDSINFIDLPANHTAKIRVVEGTTEAVIDSFYLKALIITKLEKPRGGDTISIGDVVKIYWRLNSNLIDQLLFPLSANNGNDWTSIKVGQGTPITDAYFQWTVGAEDNPPSYAVGTPVLLKMTDYSDHYRDQLILIFK